MSRCLSTIRGTAAAVFLGAIALPAAAASERPRIPVGEFCARRAAKAPTIDGKVAPGEWDEALAASGLIAPFDHRMLQAETTFRFTFDHERFYFLAECTRGGREWKLWKTARENDDYSFGDPSIEIWLTPPTLVPETYQNIINTFPAVMDVKNIPSRGYSAMGWSGHWLLAVSESPERYVIEASVPIRDFGFEGVRDGDVWRLLLCRTSPGSLPRAQASWSVTQGFNEIVQHPKVHLKDDTAVLQVLGTISIFTGKFDFPMAVVAPRGRSETVEVKMRIQREVTPADDEEVIAKSFALKAGERRAFHLAGDVTARKQGVFTISATTKDATEIFRQSFPLEVNGFVPRPPEKPAGAPEPRELDVNALYGPENNVLLVKADILDLPGRERAASAVVRVLDADSKKVLQEQAMPAFRHWYASGHLLLDRVKAPVFDTVKLQEARRQNAEREKENAKRAKQGKAPAELVPLPEAAPRKVIVEVSVRDAAGKELRAASREVPLLRYRFPWSDSDVGVTDDVIPPWTPVTYRDGTVGVWNRTMRLSGLGLLEEVAHGGARGQVERMRLVARSGGKEVEIAPSAPRLVRQAASAVTIAGAGEGAGLKLAATTRIEFDGLVLSELTIAPAGDASPAKVDKLTLEIVLPETEATHFCTTAGGWAAVHDETPKYWSSRQTASGLLVGDFVPYVWLTNGDRAFLWFADNDRGWITDDDKSLPTQEIVREGGKVTLRVHFIEVPAELKAPTTLVFGYQAFPSRPLPPGWRSIICSSGRSPHLPSGRNTYFWHDGDWAVLWPYYCSPYPWSLDKSRRTFDRFPQDTTHRPMVGSIAHSIARYRDYEGNEFPGYVVDWGATPGDAGNGNCTQGRGPADFRVWHYQRWVREGDFRGLYIDENYLALEGNFLTGGAYLRADGRLQRGYSYLGLREYYKRMKVMFHRNGRAAPNLWMHITSGAAYHAWLGDVFFEGENVEPTNLEYDYIEVLPAARMRAIGSARCAGGVMTMMCQSQRHATVYEPKHTHQFVGWVMAHDVLPEQVRFYETIAQEGRLYADDVEFLGYWRADCPAKADAPGCVVSVHRVRQPGEAPRALLWVVNTARKDQDVDVALDFGRLGLEAARTVALDAETGDMLAIRDTRLRLPVLQRDFAAVHLVERKRLADGESFVATFDDGVDADEALGSCVLAAEGRGRGGAAAEDVAPARVGGVRGAALATPFRLAPHLNLADDEGTLAFHALLPAAPKGDVLTAGRVVISFRGGKAPELVLSSDLNEDQRDARGRAVSSKHPALIKALAVPAPAAGWRQFELTWKANRLHLAIDGRAAGGVEFRGFGIGRPLGKELTDVPDFIFGGRGGAEAIDEIRCRRKAD